MSVPVDAILYEKVKKMADKKFDSKTGIYRSSWIVREYKKLGGKYTGKKSNDGLVRWYKEDWIDLNRPIRNSKNKIIGYKKCGRTKTSRSRSRSRSKSKSRPRYPLCRPSKRISIKTPKTYKEISKKSISKAKIDKNKNNFKNVSFNKKKKSVKRKSVNKKKKSVKRKSFIKVIRKK